MSRITQLIPGLDRAWRCTRGDPRVVVAILDGQIAPHDIDHNISTYFEALDPVQLSPKVPTSQQHAIEIASIIFSGHSSSVKGIAPSCFGISIPIFFESYPGSTAYCSQITLAQAIERALARDVDIINISAGQIAVGDTERSVLRNALDRCREKNVLVIAAAGNDGACSLRMPSSNHNILAVGAANEQNAPSSFTNWANEPSPTQGIIAPGENIEVLSPDGEVVCRSGTSYSAAIVSGLSALLLSLMRLSSGRIPASAVGSLIVRTTDKCDPRYYGQCERYMAGRLNFGRALDVVMNRSYRMVEEHPQMNKARSIGEDSCCGKNDSELPISNPRSLDRPPGTDGDGLRQEFLAGATEESRMQTDSKFRADLARPKEIPFVKQIAAQGLDGGRSEFVFVLGQIGVDFGTEARRDSIGQHMAEIGSIYDPSAILQYLDKNPWDAQEITWTLLVQNFPVYAIVPHGPYAEEGFKRLREFLQEQVAGASERISLSGSINGQTILSNGALVPIVVPVVRGMYNWNTKSLIELLQNEGTANNARKPKEGQISTHFTDFLQRVYNEFQNFGRLERDRALNYAATNAFVASEIFHDAARQGLQLDEVDVQRSTVCRPNSDCWDVLLTFFNPTQLMQEARRKYSMTVDVSDNVPVVVGSTRSWFVR